MADSLNLTPIVDGLYVGGMQLVYTPDALRRLKITSILKLYFTFELKLVEETVDPNNGGKSAAHMQEWPDDFEVLDIPLQFDSPIRGEQLTQGVTFIAAQQAAGKPVAVICNAGISRAATFILAYLVSQGRNLYDAWQLLRSRHPFARPTMQQWLSLLEHYNLPYTTTDILEWQADIAHH